jgi:Ca2+-binding EF-hand superfamily protein
MHALGYRNLKEQDIEKMISEVDLNKNGLLEFSEFLKVF